jgi:hypothetical protein
MRSPTRCPPSGLRAGFLSQPCHKSKRPRQTAVNIHGCFPAGHAPRYTMPSDAPNRLPKTGHSSHGWKRCRPAGDGSARIGPCWPKSGFSWCFEPAWPGTFQKQCRPGRFRCPNFRRFQGSSQTRPPCSQQRCGLHLVRPGPRRNLPTPPCETLVRRWRGRYVRGTRAPSGIRRALRDRWAPPGRFWRCRRQVRSHRGWSVSTAMPGRAKMRTQGWHVRASDVRRAPEAAVGAD